MEPEIPQTNFKSMAMVLWIALITAIVVTIIDWKIKQDILRLTDAFYRIYPSTMESQHEGPINKEALRQRAENTRRPAPDPVLRFPVVDSNPRVEAEDAPTSLSKDPEDHSSDWAKFAPDIETRLESRTAKDS